MTGSTGQQSDRRETLYRQAAEAHGGMIARLAAGYEGDPALREDLEQEIHLQLWRSFDLFAGQCSLATWTHRVAHNVSAQHVDRAVRGKRIAALADLGDLEVADKRAGPEEHTDTALTLERLYRLIRRLRPLDRQVVLLYLEDVDAAGIAEITGLTAGAVATRIHRIKALLAQAFVPEATA
jgi:RNA polymerase sigma-70 factor (ECF subfamily)